MKHKAACFVNEANQITKITAGLFILTGFAFYLLNSPSVSAKDDSPVVTTSSLMEDIDRKEKDLGREELLSTSDSNRRDIDPKEKDLGRGERLNTSAAPAQDIDPNEKDMGQGEPFIQSNTFLVNDRGTDDKTEEAQVGDGEILLGKDFTDAIKGKKFSEQSLLKTITLQKNPPLNEDEIHFKNNPGLFVEGEFLEEINAAKSPELPEAVPSVQAQRPEFDLVLPEN